MKKYDFTKPNGFPLTQDRLKRMQDAYSELFGALGLLGGATTTPLLISGLVGSTVTGGTNYTSGWFWYNNEMVYCAGGFVGALGMSHSLYMVISTSATTLTYKDGSTPSVVLENTGVLTSLPTGTTVDTTHFLVSSLVPWAVGMGALNREQTWQHIAVSTAAGHGTVTGDIYYKKDKMANTLQIRGSLSCASAQDFAVLPGSEYEVAGTLGVGYRPANVAYFTMMMNPGDTNVMDYANLDYIMRLNASIGTDGKVNVNWIKPDAGTASYTVVFNCLVPLE